MKRNHYFIHGHGADEQKGFVNNTFFIRLIRGNLVLYGTEAGAFVMAYPEIIIRTRV